MISEVIIVNLFYMIV